MQLLDPAVAHIHDQSHKKPETTQGQATQACSYNKELSGSSGQKLQR
ncbi:hypothetical protein KR100_07890 [Synechococcus sp. KORDI-100]|nr:hypothetical protein KR100_07890 [Synechococcus sp. KORDI-100]